MFPYGGECVQQHTFACQILQIISADNAVLPQRTNLLHIVKNAGCFGDFQPFQHHVGTNSDKTDVIIPKILTADKLIFGGGKDQENVVFSDRFLSICTGKLCRPPVNQAEAVKGKGKGMLQRSHIGFVHEMKGGDHIRCRTYRDKFTDIVVFFHRSKQNQDGGQTGQRRSEIGFAADGFSPHKADQGGKDHYTAGNDGILYRGGQESQGNLTEEIADAVAECIAGQTQILLSRRLRDALLRDQAVEQAHRKQCQLDGCHEAVAVHRKSRHGQMDL